MAFDYPSLRDGLVEPQIADKGKPGQLSVNENPTGGDPWDSQIGTPGLYPVTLVELEFKKETHNGTLVEKNDLLFLVSTEGVTVDPQLADRMIVAGVEYQVVSVMPKAPGQTTMFWKIHVRK